MNNKIEVLNIYHHFVTGSINKSVNGLYEIKMNNHKYTIFRNGDSWGALIHWAGEPVEKCMENIRPDMIKMIEEAIERSMNRD